MRSTIIAGAAQFGQHASLVALTLAAALQAAGCARAVQWTPAPAELGSFEKLGVEQTTRRGSVRELRFGDWTAADIDVSWARGSGDGVRVGRVGGDASRSRQVYRFTLQGATPEAVTGVECESALQQQEASVRSLDIRLSTRSTLECSWGDAGERLRLSLRGGEHPDTGSVTGGAVDYIVHALDRDSRVAGGRVRSFAIRRGAMPVATIDVRGRAVWLATGAAGRDRDVAAAAAAALLLYPR